MIRFEFNGFEYTLRFIYKQKDGLTPNSYAKMLENGRTVYDLDGWDRKHPVITVAEIRRGLPGSKDADKEDFALGVAFQHENDQHVKEIARRTALTHALDERNDARFRDLRTAIWEAYYDRSAITI